MPDTADLFESLEHAIRTLFIKTITRKEVNDVERNLIALPVRYGGLGIGNPVDLCKISHANSLFVSAPLVRLVARQEAEFGPRELQAEVIKLRAEIDKRNETTSKAKLQDVLGSASPVLKKAVQAASEKGASSWLTAVPTYDHGTILHKGDFVDSLCIRYGWAIQGLPLNCGCGAPFSLQHALD